MKAATNNSKVRTGINNVFIQSHKRKKRDFVATLRKMVCPNPNAEENFNTDVLHMRPKEKKVINTLSTSNKYISQTNLLVSPILYPHVQVLGSHQKPQPKQASHRNQGLLSSLWSILIAAFPHKIS